MKKQSYFYLLGLLYFLTGCAPSLGKEIRIPPLFDNVKPTDSMPDFIAPTRVINFKDDRTNPILVKINDKVLEAPEELGAHIAEGVKRILAAQGYMVVGRSAPIVSGVVERWYGAVDINFPITTVNSSAALKVVVLNSNKIKIFEDIFYGTSEISGLTVSKAAITNSLKSAMEDAILNAVNDPRFVLAVRGMKGIIKVN